MQISVHNGQKDNINRKIWSSKSPAAEMRLQTEVEDMYKTGGLNMTLDKLCYH